MIDASSILRTCGLLTCLLSPGTNLARAEERNVRSDEETRKTAKALIGDGNELLESGQPARAIERYQAAYQLYPSAKIFYNLAEAYRDLGDFVDASTHYQRFLEEAAMPPGSKLYEAARRALDDLDKKLARVSVGGSPPGAKVYLDGRSIGTLPIEGARAKPGLHRIAAEMDGHSRSEVEVDLRPGAAARVSIALDPAALPQPPRLGETSPSDAPTAPQLGPPRNDRDLPVQDERLSVETISIAGDDRGTIFEEWWLWTVVGVAVAAGVGALVLAGGRDTFELESELRPSSTAEWSRIR